MNMKNRSVAAALSAAVLLITCGTSMGAGLALRKQPAPAAPESTPSTTAPEGTVVQTKEVPIFVRAVQGTVFFKEQEGAPLKKCDVGTVLPAGAIIMTGTKGMVQIQVGAGQIFTVDFKSQVKLREVININGTEKTSIDMPFGRIAFDVTSTQVANDVKITAPDATLAVKGTSGSLESRAGFEPKATGGMLNKGRFDVIYDNKIAAVITGSEKSTGNKPSPADLERGKHQVDTGPDRARDDQEQQALQDQGVSSPVNNNTPSSRLVASDSGIFKPTGTLFGETYGDLGESGTSLVERDVFGNVRPAIASITGVQGVIQGGTVVIDPQSGERVLVVIDNVFGPNGNTPTFRSLNLTQNQTSYHTLGSIAPTPNFGGFDSYTLYGIGMIEGRLFSQGVGPQFEQGQIFEITAGSYGQGGTPGTASISQIMSVNAQLQPALAAAPSRGSLFVIGTPNNFGGAGPSGQWVLYELNPVTQQIVTTHSSTGPRGDEFANQTGTVATPGFSFAIVQQITGMSYANGVLVLSGRTIYNQPVTIYYNPDATNSPSDPTVRIVDGYSTAFSGTLVQLNDLVNSTLNDKGPGNIVKENSGTFSRGKRELQSMVQSGRREFNEKNFGRMVSFASMNDRLIEVSTKKPTTAGSAPSTRK